MKKTNKIIAMFAAMVMVLSLMVGCGGNANVNMTGNSNDGVLGTWKCVSFTMAGTTTDMAEAGVNETIEFKPDGTTLILVTRDGGMEMKQEGTWEQDGNNITLLTYGIEEEGTLDGDTLTIETNGMTMLFTR